MISNVRHVSAAPPLGPWQITAAVDPRTGKHLNDALSSPTMKVWVVATDVVEGWVDVHFIGSTFFPKPSGGTERFVGGLRLNIPFDLVDVRTGEVVAERR